MADLADGRTRFLLIRRERRRPQADADRVERRPRLAGADVAVGPQQKRTAIGMSEPLRDELRQHMANTVARHNRRGWRLDKPSLDAVVGLLPVEVIGWL